MMNAFDEATAIIRLAIKDQTNKLLGELEAANNHLMKAGLEFDTEMGSITKDRLQLDEMLRKERAALDDKERRNRASLDDRERRARTKLTAALTDNQAVMISLHNQISDGTIHTGDETIYHQEGRKLPAEVMGSLNDYAKQIWGDKGEENAQES